MYNIGIYLNGSATLDDLTIYNDHTSDGDVGTCITAIGSGTVMIRNINSTDPMRIGSSVSISYNGTVPVVSCASGYQNTSEGCQVSLYKRIAFWRF